MKNNNPLISVIMSVYNNSNTLSESIESIVTQDYNNLEFLIMDDGSNDDSLNILRTFEESDTRIKVFVNKRNLGLTKSLNILISEAKGEIIARQDADDISYKQRLSKQFSFMLKKNLDLVTARANRVNSNKKIPNISFYIPKKIVIKYKNPFIHGTLFIKKTILKSVGNYDEDFYYAQDYKLMSDLIKNNYKIGFIKEPLYLLNQEDNISKLYKKEQAYYANCVRNNKLPDLSY